MVTGRSFFFFFFFFFFLFAKLRWCGCPQAMRRRSEQPGRTWAENGRGGAEVQDAPEFRMHPKKTEPERHEPWHVEHAAEAEQRAASGGQSADPHAAVAAHVRVVVPPVRL
eukprot:NODE_6154_length_526_cov_176.405520.p2 GENE.NODE_6154_length_526_cov_176.405520~~NODE_6154_length_526_cov_176.405520.p2  ORF type:complete len:121 (+),score=52.23 NODE_6154_length_526_cov_176.405520:31-363(+)